MSRCFLLLCEDNHWQITRLLGEKVETRDIDGNAEAIPVLKAALVEWGYSGEGVCLALPSDMILTARILSEDLPRRQRRNAMLSRLEEQLPADLESLTADFLPLSGRTALGVAVQTSRAREMMDRLAGIGIEVGAICPLALLTLWGIQAHCLEDDYVLIGTRRNFDLMRVHKGLPSSWYTSAAIDEDLRQCIMADSLAEPIPKKRPTACVVADPAVIHAMESSAAPLLVTHSEPEAPLVIATRAAADLLAGKPAGWVDLLRDALAPANNWGRGGHLVRLTPILALVLCATLTFAFLWRARQYRVEARRLYELQEEAYQKLHPGEPAGGIVKRRLTSELARLSAISGGSVEAPKPVNALETLRRIAVSLPPSIHIRVLELRIGQDSALIEGQTESHTGAELLRTEMVHNGFVMEPPSTETMPSGEVSFSLTGTPPRPAEVVEKGNP